MSYEPTVWRTGDKVTAPLMNKLEQGVAAMKGGALTVTLLHEYDEQNDSYIVTADKTASEMYEACKNGGIHCVFTDGDEYEELNIVLQLLSFAHYSSNASGGIPSGRSGGQKASGGSPPPPIYEYGFAFMAYMYPNSMLVQAFASTGSDYPVFEFDADQSEEPGVSS